MRHTAFRLLAIGSAALLLTAAANGRTRPRYGESVRAETGAVVSVYEAVPDVLTGPVFETLVTVDDTGHLQPGLATSWASPNNGLRWEFFLRSGVQFHDGSPLTPISVAEPIAKAGIAGCKVMTATNAVVLDCENATPDVPAQLSRSKYSIYALGTDNQVYGTGPFRIERRELGQFSLRANDEYWGGSPYLASVHLATGVNARDQVTDFALERADIVELATDQLRHALQERWRLDVSRPSETVLLTVALNRPELKNPRLRQAIALAIDRASIHNVIFQRQGEVANGLLPNWLTGYAFLFPATQDIAKGRELLRDLGRVPQLTIGYDTESSVDRLIAERVALNVRDIGISMVAVPNRGNTPDLRILHFAVKSLDPQAALTALLERTGISARQSSDDPEALFNEEATALQSYMAIPLVHLPRVTALKNRVRNWMASPLGEWRLDDLWIASRPIGREGRP